MIAPLSRLWALARQATMPPLPGLHCQGEGGAAVLRAGRLWCSTGSPRFAQAALAAPILGDWLQDSSLPLLLRRLEHRGEGFELNARDADGQCWHLRGFVQAGHALLRWQKELNGLAALADLPVPLWLIGAGKQPLWRNQLARQLALPEASRDGRVVRYTDGNRRIWQVYQQGQAAVAVDVTEAQQLEAKLRFVERSHREALDQLKNGIAIFGADRRLEFFNPALARLWRLDPVWLEGRPDHRAILDALRERRRLPDMADFPGWKAQMLALYTRATWAGTAANFPDEIWHLADATALHVVTLPHPDGGIMQIVEDVTDRLALERRYNSVVDARRATLDRLDQGVAVLAGDGRLDSWNPAFARLWRLGPDRLASRPTAEELGAWCAAIAGDPLFWSALIAQSQHEARRQARQRVRGSSGVAFDVAAASLPDGSVLLTTTDAADSDRIEAALRERAEAEASADRLKRAFLEQVSYRLRTPLASILGFAEILREGMAGELTIRQQGYVDGILTASAELRSLIDDVIALAAAEAGELALEPVPLAADRLLQSAMSLVATRVQDRRLRLRLLGEGLLQGDEARLRQAFFNLLADAVERAPEGSEITLRIETGADVLTITILDHGPPPEAMADAFEAFRSRDDGGIGRDPGLALALARRYISLHKGRLSVAALADGQGRQVVITLPRAAQHG